MGGRQKIPASAYGPVLCRQRTGSLYCWSPPIAVIAGALRGIAVTGGRDRAIRPQARGTRLDLSVLTFGAQLLRNSRSPSSRGPKPRLKATVAHLPSPSCQILLASPSLALPDDTGSVKCPGPSPSLTGGNLVFPGHHRFGRRSTAVLNGAGFHFCLRACCSGNITVAGLRDSMSCLRILQIAALSACFRPARTLPPPRQPKVETNSRGPLP